MHFKLNFGTNHNATSFENTVPFQAKLFPHNFTRNCCPKALKAIWVLDSPFKGPFQRYVLLVGAGTARDGPRPPSEFPRLAYPSPSAQGIAEKQAQRDLTPDFNATHRACELYPMVRAALGILFNPRSGRPGLEGGAQGEVRGWETTRPSHPPALGSLRSTRPVRRPIWSP